jgi:homoserine kinase
MTSPTASRPGPIRLKLPATSANLGPGFDAVGLAMAFYLTIDASVGEAFSIVATGRNADICARVEDSLILTTYQDVVEAAGGVPIPLALVLANEIPLGMGCGSSAAALLAGVALANHFGELGWTEQQVLEEACRREGHPDNVAACWAGAMTSSAMAGSRVITATCGRALTWKLLIVLPQVGLATAKARALLPESYSKADAIANVQATALLVSAFALDRGDLLRHAMEDRLHQPYRTEACPLLSYLAPMMHEAGVLGFALSGAGPSVLLVTEESASVAALVAKIELLTAGMSVEVIETVIAAGYITAV